VGTSSTFITRVLSGCLPGYSGVTQTPCDPDSRGRRAGTPARLNIHMGLSHEGDNDAHVPDGNMHPSATCSTCTNHGFRFPGAGTTGFAPVGPRRPPPSRNACAFWKFFVRGNYWSSDFFLPPRWPRPSIVVTTTDHIGLDTLEPRVAPPDIPCSGPPSRL